MWLLRNREVVRALVAWAALSVAAAVLGFYLAAWPGAVLALIASMLASIPFLALTWRRYRMLAQLSERIDDVLHGERSLDFSTMAEGELAILGSELDKMVMRLNLTADELAREKQALADALADISHQIKTPLTSLSITTELVRKHLAEVPECAEDLERMRRIEQLEIRVEHLVATLLKLARLDAGTIRLACDRVLVGDVVGAAVQPLAVALDIADVALRTDVADGCSFCGDLAWTAEALGNKVTRLYDVGVAGLHRLLAHTDDIMGASAIVAIAGMEGALASVIGGLADCPVIAVPTSVGYGASFGGLSALLSMLNSCASGVSVVNIDNGFGAGYLASMINHIGVK